MRVWCTAPPSCHKLAAAKEFLTIRWVYKTTQNNNPILIYISSLTFLLIYMCPSQRFGILVASINISYSVLLTGLGPTEEGINFGGATEEGINFGGGA